MATRGELPELLDKETNAFLPDQALNGYSPSRVREWYEGLDAPVRSKLLQLWLVDAFGIIPTYVFLLGTSLVASGCPGILCYLPIWIATLDLIETVTHFSAVLALHVAELVDVGDEISVVWKPSEFQLVVASEATRFKYLLWTVSLLVIAVCQAKRWWHSWGPPSQPKAKIE